MARAQEAIDTSYLSRPDATDLDHIPGTDGFPYFGEGLRTIWGLEKLLEDHYKKWGEVSRVKLLHQRGILVMGTDNYGRIFLDKEQNFSTEMGFAESIGQFYKGGILMKDFGEHKFLRRMMQTAFKNAAMKNYVGMMNPIMQQHIEQWDKVQGFQFAPHIKETLLEVGAKVFIGAEAGEETRRMNKAFLDINDGLMGQIRKEWPGTRYAKGKKGERYLRSYFSAQIPIRRDGDATDMLSFMCREKTDEGEYFPDDLIIPQGSFLLFAAHDTTTSVLNHMVYYSATHPEWQEKMREEALALGKPYLDYEDLDNMVVMDRVFHESLRLRPSVAFFARRTINECEIGGHRIPRDTMVFLSPVHNHLDARYWTNPHDFDPDRFLPERAEHKNHSFCYHPFGGGAHKCIGMHFAGMLTRVFMFELLKQYRYRTPAGYKPTMLWLPLPKPARLPLVMERI